MNKAWIVTGFATTGKENGWVDGLNLKTMDEQCFTAKWADDGMLNDMMTVEEYTKLFKEYYEKVCPKHKKLHEMKQETLLLKYGDRDFQNHIQDLNVQWYDTADKLMEKIRPFGLDYSDAHDLEDNISKVGEF